MLPHTIWVGERIAKHPYAVKRIAPALGARERPAQPGVPQDDLGQSACGGDPNAWAAGAVPQLCLGASVRGGAHCPVR